MRILRAFAWLRWRVLVNSLERTGSRDKIERFSAAIAQLGPIVTVILTIPSAIAIAGAAAYAGWALAGGEERPLPFEVLRYLLFVASVLTVVGPLLLPAAERTNAVRLLLLPISRPLLYVAQAATVIADPWIALSLPIVLFTPIGLAAGGAIGASIAVALAGILLLLVLIGIALLASGIMHLVLRNRRRGELLALAFLLLVPLLSLLPGTLVGSDDVGGSRDEDRQRLVRWISVIERRALPLAPSEMYVRATRAAPLDAVTIVGPIAGLAIAAGLVHCAGLLVFGRVLDSPGASSARRRGQAPRSRAWRFPGLAPPTSAVAVNQIRLVLRTPRGRSILLSPLMLFAMFSLFMWRASAADLGFIRLGSGTGLAVFASWVSLVAILPMAMNQFSVDRAGLTLALLAPIGDAELLLGKAIGNGVIAAVPTWICTAGAALMFGEGNAGVWLAIPIGLLAAYTVVSPVAAALSALFPRAVNLNSIGTGSNAHGAAGFLGFVALTAASAVTLLIGITTMRWLGGAWLLPVVMLLWFALCALAAWLLFIPARAIFARRRENLVLIR